MVSLMYYNIEYHTHKIYWISFSSKLRLWSSGFETILRLTVSFPLQPVWITCLQQFQMGRRLLPQRKGPLSLTWSQRPLTGLMPNLTDLRWRWGAHQGPSKIALVIPLLHQLKALQTIVVRMGLWMVGPRKKGRIWGLTCRVNGGRMQWMKHPPKTKLLSKFPVSLIKRHQGLKLVSTMSVTMRFVSGQNGSSQSVWMVPWKSVRPSTMSGKAGDSPARLWSKSSRIVGMIQTLFCSSAFVQHIFLLVQWLYWNSFTCESYFAPLWTSVVYPFIPWISSHLGLQPRFQTKETFCAEVEILRAEMQSSELVVEGEFLTHDAMIEKGMSEHFGTSKSFKVSCNHHIPSLSCWCQRIQTLLA